MTYAFFFLLPVLAWIGFQKLWFNHRFTWGEIAVQASVSAVLLIGLFLAGNASQTYDVKFVNGVVTSAEAKRQDCPWGWRDYRDGFCTEYRTRTVPDGQTCTTDSKGKRTCTTRYKTQYNYIYSWEQRYFVESDIPTDYEINRVDRQGANTPPRFAEISVGDPVAAQISYTNYIRGASASLLHRQTDEPVELDYPEIEDYYRAQRVLTVGETGVDTVEWSRQLMKLNSDIRATGANVVIVLTDRGDGFSEELARTWDAHNVNDVVVSIGVADGRVAWADARSWSKNSLVNVEIRDGIMDQKELDIAAIDAIIMAAIENSYEAPSMEEFEYLANEIRPPLWTMILAFLLLLVATPAASYFFHKNDVL